jgi:hypothetical protein
MNNRKATLLTQSKLLLSTYLLAISGICWGGNLPSLIDDFSSSTANSLGFPRYFMNDSVAGGGTEAGQEISEGAISTKGNIVPPRGQPGWASIILPVGMENTAQDASAFEGLRLLVKINTGNISISANSTEITNFDYHTAPISVTADGKFHEIKIPFTSMKRNWSEQTPLNTKTLNSRSITAFGFEKTSFDFVLDEVSFY